MKAGRNDPCPCGSGQKYKRCCLADHERKDSETLAAQRRNPYYDLSPDYCLEETDCIEFPSLHKLAKWKPSSLAKRFPVRTLIAGEGVLLSCDLKLDRVVDRDRKLDLTVVFSSSRFDSGSAVHLFEDPAGNADIPVIATCSECPTGYDGSGCKHVAAALGLLLNALKPEEESFQVPSKARFAVTQIQTALKIEKAPPPKRENAPAEVLKALVFRLPKDFDGEWTDLLSSGRSVAAGALKRSPVRFLDRRISEAFRPKTFLTRQPWHDSREQNALASCLEYRFESGLILTSAEILHHKACESLPPQWLPVPLTDSELRAAGRPSQYSGYFRLRSVDADFWSYHLGEIERRIGDILASVASAVAAGELQFYLTTDHDPRHERRVLRVNQIAFDPAAHFAWLLDCRHGRQLGDAPCFSLRLGTHPAPTPPSEGSEDWQMAPALSVSASRRILLLHPWDEEQDLLYKLGSYLKGQRRAAELDPPSPDDVTSPLIPVLRIRSQIGALFAAESLRARQLPLVVLPSSRDAVETVPEIWLSANGKFSFVRRTLTGAESEEVRVRGLSSLGIPWLIAFEEGIGNALGLASSDFPSDSRRKRELDLKILKHRGLAAFLFCEAVCVAAEGRLTPLSSGGAAKNARSMIDLLTDRIFLLVAPKEARNEGGEAPALRKSCSKAVMQAMERFAQAVIDSYSGKDGALSVFSPEGEIRSAEAVKWELLLLKALLESAAFRTGGDCFTKARLSPLSWLTTQVLPEGFAEEPCVETGSTTSDAGWWRGSQDGESPSLAELLSLCSPLQELGFRLRIDGQEMESLGQDDFRWNLGLGEGELDWFELHPEFFLKGEEIPEKDALHLLREGYLEFRGKLYRVPRSALPGYQRLERLWSRLRGRGKKKPSGPAAQAFLLPRSQVLELLALRASGIPVAGGPRFTEIAAFYDSLDRKRKPLKLPPTVKASLKPYQEAGVLWLQDLERLGLGGILADEMGLGKTLQALAFLELLRSERRLRKALIVVPTSLTFNWKSEASRFTPGLDLRTFDPKKRQEAEAFLEAAEPGAVLVSYGLLAEHEEFFAKYSFTVAVFDEAQSVKNLATQRARAARRIDARFKLALTGTPLENHFGELYSILDLVVPGCLGDLQEFYKTYVRASPVDVGDMQHLRLKTKPLILRRLKSELLSQLPEKRESKVVIPFTERQRKIYRDIATSWNERVRSIVAAEGEARSQLHMLTALLRLRQVCSCPSALEGVKYPETPPKLEALADSLREIVESGESALVFTQFLETYRQIEAKLASEGIATFGLHGTLSRAARETALNGFERHAEGAVMLMTLKTGGVGLNLTKASYVFHVEPWWNPAVENQATDRAHRIGQSKAVQVYRYIMHESVEEKIELLKERKEKRFAAMFGGQNLAEAEAENELHPGSSRLTKADFDLLLQ